MTWRWRWLIHLLAVAMFATGLTLVLQRQGVIGGSDESDLPPLAAMPFDTSVSVIGSTTTRIGSTVQLSAAGYSPAGTKQVAVYDGARRVATVTAGRHAHGTSLSLPATSVGQHLVHAEVTDRDGKVSKSAPVTLEVAPGQGKSPIPVAVSPEPGETVAVMARRFAVPATSLVIRAPDGKAYSGRDPIPPKSRVTVLIDPKAGLDTLTGRRIVVDPAVKVGGDALGLAVAAKGCAVELEVLRTTGAVTFFHASATVPGWARVARPSKDPSRSIDDLSPGVHVFYAKDDDRTSAQVSVTVPQSCASRFGWTGEASIVDGTLILPKGAVGQYLHLSVDGRPWLRAPAQAGELLSLHSGADVAAHLPALNGHRLDLEVWTTSSGSDIPPIHPVATGHLTVPGDRTLASVVGEPGGLSLTVDGPDGPAGGVSLGSDNATLHFDWSSASSRTDSVQWQVLSQEVGSSNRDLTPPGLLASGISQVEDGSAAVYGGGRKGSFTMDTSKLPVQGSASSGKSAAGAVLLKSPVTPGTVRSLGSAAYGTRVPAAAIDDAVADVLPSPNEGDTVWVRVLARAEGGGVSAASAPAYVVLPIHESAKTELTFKVDSLTIDPGRAPYKPAAGCLVVDVPWQGVQPQADVLRDGADYETKLMISVASAFYKHSGVYCPGAFPPAECDFLCDVVDFIVDAAGVVVGFVVDVFSLVSYAYNGVIEAVVTAIAKYNPLCVALGAASSDAGDGCSAVVGVATRAAVTAALASVGLPPSLPSGDALKAVAAGNFAELAVELMKQANIPCDEVKAPAGFGDTLETAGDQLGSNTGGAAAALDNPCLAIATMLISAVADEAEAAAEQTVAAAGGLPAFPTVKGLTMRPDPRAALQPLRVSVKARLVKDSADGTGATCRMVTYNPLLKGRPSTVDPYPWRSIELTEDKPVDGKGTWSGSVAASPNPARANVMDLLQPRTFDLGVDRYMSHCLLPPTVGTGTIKPPEADLDNIVKEPAKVTLP